MLKITVSDFELSVAIHSSAPSDPHIRRSQHREHTHDWWAARAVSFNLRVHLNDFLIASASDPPRTANNWDVCFDRANNLFWLYNALSGTHTAGYMHICMRRVKWIPTIMQRCVRRESVPGVKAAPCAQTPPWHFVPVSWHHWRGQGVGRGLPGRQPHIGRTRD